MFFGKIGIDTAFQVLCLADIDDGASLVEILVAARAVGQIADDAHQVGTKFILPSLFHCVFIVVFFRLILFDCQMVMEFSDTPFGATLK